MMRTVQRKLLLVVILCVGPAFLAAYFRAREAEGDLLDQVRTRMDLADEAFVGDLEEDLEGSRLALGLASSNPRLVRDLASDDAAHAQRLISTLAKGLDDAAIAVVDLKGRLVASSGSLGGSSTLFAEGLPELTPIWQGHPVSTLLPLALGGKRVYALVTAQPLLDNDNNPVGAIVLARPMDSAYLNHAKQQLGSDWALLINGQLVAESAGHPAPALTGAEDAVVTVRQSQGHYYAMNSFKPALLQRPGQVVMVTASQDVTGLRLEVRRDLYRSLGILGGVLLAAVAVALWLGQGMVSAIHRISRAARDLRSGQYTLAEGIRSGDELEQLADAFNEAVAGLRERDQLKETFGKYVTRQVAEQILQGKAVLGGETVPVTVLFSDIRGFTTISERMEPKALLDFLNAYFSRMVESVMKHTGVVDKFIGDAIMAVFGAPVPQPDDALRAVRSALDMRARLQACNREFASRGLPEIRIGIGIHSGTVVAGNMGHQERMEYTVIGDSVNLASRLESLTKELGVDILLSEDTYLKVQEHVLAEPLQRIRVRGRAQEVLVYKLVDLKQLEAAPRAA